MKSPFHFIIETKRKLSKSLQFQSKRHLKPIQFLGPVLYRFSKKWQQLTKLNAKSVSLLQPRNLYVRQVYLQGWKCMKKWKLNRKWKKLSSKRFKQDLRQRIPLILSGYRKNSRIHLMQRRSRLNLHPLNHSILKRLDEEKMRGTIWIQFRMHRRNGAYYQLIDTHLHAIH